jgi:Response regulator of the LytR/AlgR family
MDIHLADGSAFEIFERTTIKCPVIFTTAYDEYALKAFKVNSIDYLLKPISTSAVEKALDKLKSLSNNNMPGEIQELLASFKKQPNYKSNFLVPGKGDKLIPLSADNIAYIYIESGITRIRTTDEKTYVMEENLDELMQVLNPNQFFRANRQFIVARNAVKDIDLWFNNRLSINMTISVPEKIIVSKARNTEFKEWFTNF